MASLWQPLKKYANWIHLQYPAGRVEQLPKVNDQFESSVPGIYVVGDLAGIPLLKYSIDSGTRSARTIAQNTADAPPTPDNVRDLVIIGAGASGMAAAREAKEHSLDAIVLEASRTFATIKDFQAEKPIYTYPRDMTPAGSITVDAPVKEKLVEQLEAQTRDLPVEFGRVDYIDTDHRPFRIVMESGRSILAANVIVAIGRSGNYRQLDVPGEDLGHVHHHLHDPGPHRGEDVLVVGGGDSAAEAAIALAEAGARVTLSYRRDTLVRPKQENIDRVHQLAEGEGGPGKIKLIFESEVEEIHENEVRLGIKGREEVITADVVYALIGREIPVSFFRKSGIELKNDWGNIPDTWQRATETLSWLPDARWDRIAAFAAFFLFMAAVYSWTDGGWLARLSETIGGFPHNLADAAQAQESASLFGVLLTSMQAPAFYFTFVYSAIIVIFGYRRVMRRKTPYVLWQTVVLAIIQVLPLFILPELLLPYAGAHELLPSGMMDGLFPESEYASHGREYWRAYGFILAWPLLVYNVFTQDPLWWWLAICFVQTFVLIPGMIYFWGKGAYCSWICSCGAMAETLGDTQREKMPHGEKWNAFNMAGQVIMVIAFVLLFTRIIGWIWPDGGAAWFFNVLMYGEIFGLELNYAWVVDVVLAGMVGYGVYFWLSGRFWCRFLCPLAALMHIYTKFTRFRILADKEKCISCNACTSACHQGIDVMHYAQQGIPMDDPQCVRCSACVQTCPTGVLTFGQIDTKTGQVITTDELEASLARIQEKEAA